MAGERPARETAAEDCGVEITPAMIEAGAAVAVQFGLHDEPECAAIAIYDAMWRANRKYLPSHAHDKQVEYE